ncbi:hypothetical protein PPYR_12984 [Photinus pyralis]|uniref:MAGE domain-containing protein n=1 Tax=Photinus pyralis TaxID=7054 RepID=A0A1Y1JSK5_PHOPY|nr:non-structural maintenance of chromosomes element 3 homolog [Photinus pyralis]KAB0793364.1 hypothetical protein PPYR_12984 [Photinus pyralis]
MGKRGRRSQASQSASQTSNSTQLTLEVSFNNSQRVVENLDELVNACVRYVLYHAGSRLPIRKADLQKHVLKNVGRSYNMILEKVKAVLKDIYGYDLYVCEEQKSVIRYLVSNSLPNKGLNQQCDNDVPEDAHKILTMLILTHIFMSNNTTTEAGLFSFLNSLNIDVEETHDVFGNVKTFIQSTLVQQRFLHMETDNVTKRHSYTWGPRAEHEVSKHELLKFVCKIYKDSNPKSWSSQLECADKQFNVATDENESMEVGDN